MRRQTEGGAPREAYAPGGAPNLKLLFVSPYAPSLIRTRPYNLILSLAKRGHAITLATVWESETERAGLEALAQHGIRIWSQPLSGGQRARNVLTALTKRAPLQAWYCWQPELARGLAQALTEDAGQFDAIHVEHLRGAEYGRNMVRALQNTREHVPVIWDSVDCISLLFEQARKHSQSGFGRIISRLELPRTRRYEAEAVTQFECVLATSPRDQAALMSLAATYGRQATRGHRWSAASVKLLPNGVDGDYFVPSKEPATQEAEPAQLILTGKMSYHANATAALHLVNDIMPMVWQHRPEVEVVLAGSAPPPKVRALGERPDGRVRVTGFVPDLRPYLWAASMAVAPITYGAGIQNKVLEAMACGRPVVASSQASSALQTMVGRELLTAETPRDFADRILCLLDSRNMRETLGQAGRRYVREQHDWNAIAARLEGYYIEAGRRQQKID